MNKLILLLYMFVTTSLLSFAHHESKKISSDTICRMYVPQCISATIQGISTKRLTLLGYMDLQYQTSTHHATKQTILL